MGGGGRIAASVHKLCTSNSIYPQWSLKASCKDFEKQFLLNTVQADSMVWLSRNPILQH